jgi:hypothetical protein
MVGGQAGGPLTAAGGVRRPDFGQPQKPADLRGVVTAVVGNQVTILKIAVTGGQRGASSTPGTADASSSSASRTPALSLGTDGGSRGAFRGGQGGPTGPGGPDSTSNRATMIAQLKAMSTGSETITIPVGIKMMKFGEDPDTQKKIVEEATLGDIATDKMITVWLDGSVTDQKTASFVLIN